MTPNTVEPPLVQDPEPQVKKKRSILPWILLLAIAGAATYFYPRLATLASPAVTKKGGKGGEAGRPVPVVASLARRGDMPVYLNGLGSVLAFNTVTLRTRVDGQIMKVYFQEGQFVKEGDPLIEIDPKPFQVQLEMAEGQLARDQALLDNAKIDLARYTVLFAQEAIPKQQLDTQVALVSQNNATLKSDQAQIDTAKLQLFYAHITSPLTGRIGLRLVDGGNMVHATDATGLAVITQLQPIAVIFNIAEDSLPPGIEENGRGQYRRRSWPTTATLKTKLATGTLRDHRQSDRSDHRDGPLQSGVRKPGSFAVPESICERAAAARYQTRRDHHPHSGDPAQSAIDFRVCSESRQHRGGAQYKRRNHRRR